VAQAYRIKPTPKRSYRFNVLPYLGRALLESGFLVFIGSALFLLIALLTYQPTDPAWTHTAPGVPVANRGGAPGAWFADVAFYFFGYLAYLFPLGVAFCGWRLFRNQVLWQLDAEIILFRLFGFLVTISSGCGLAALHLGVVDGYPSASPGGIFGAFLASWLGGAFPMPGSTAFLGVLFAAGVTLATGFSWLDILDGVGTGTMNLVQVLGRWVLGVKAWVEAEDLDSAATGKTEPTLTPDPSEPPSVPDPVSDKHEAAPVMSATGPEVEFVGPVTPFTADEAPTRLARPGKRARVEPSLGIAGQSAPADWAGDGRTPGVPGERFEAPGKTAPPRPSIVKPVPQSPVAATLPISLLDPATPRQVHALRTLLSAQAYQASTAGLPLIVGYGADARPCVIDLLQLPHLLAAGDDADAVIRLVHTFLLSLLYKAPPRALRLILLDSATRDLAVYRDIPHLLLPIATGIEQAVNALVWCKKEIDRRRRLLAEEGVPDVETLSRRWADSGAVSGAALESDHGEPAPLPAVVVVIAELADIVEVMGDWVDTLFAKLSVKGKNAGVHLLLATHRPSADVITATLKAGLPARVALQVGSAEASHQILDGAGADQLSATELLYLSPDADAPRWLRTALVGLPEVERVTAYLRQLGQT
jgi:S-DNA-T family DNA segregation ATPase FtsK/SpoIIIE